MSITLLVIVAVLPNVLANPLIDVIAFEESPTFSVLKTVLLGYISHIAIVKGAPSTMFWDSLAIRFMAAGTPTCLFGFSLMALASHLDQGNPHWCEELCSRLQRLGAEPATAKRIARFNFFCLGVEDSPDISKDIYPSDEMTVVGPGSEATSQVMLHPSQFAILPDSMILRMMDAKNAVQVQWLQIGIAFYQIGFGVYTMLTSEYGVVANIIIIMYMLMSLIQILLSTLGTQAGYAYSIGEASEIDKRTVFLRGQGRTDKIMDQQGTIAELVGAEIHDETTDADGVAWMTTLYTVSLFVPAIIIVPILSRLGMLNTAAGIILAVWTSWPLSMSLTFERIGSIQRSTNKAQAAVFAGSFGIIFIIMATYCSIIGV